MMGAKVARGSKMLGGAGTPAIKFITRKIFCVNYLVQHSSREKEHRHVQSNLRLIGTGPRSTLPYTKTETISSAAPGRNYLQYYGASKHRVWSRSPWVAHDLHVYIQAGGRGVRASRGERKRPRRYSTDPTRTYCRGFCLT